MKNSTRRSRVLSRRLVGLTAASAFVIAPLMAVSASATTLEEDNESVVTEAVIPEEDAAEETEVSESAASAADEAISAATEQQCDLTVMSTTDVHGHVYNWDYFTNAEYTGKNQLGLARVMTSVEEVRAEQGADSVLLIDNGDAIQGTPLTYLAALQPDRLPFEANPMATAFNTMQYDVQVLGNHEFNYGLDYLADYQSQLNAPLLGANVLKAGTTETAFQPYEIVEKEVCGETVKVGVIGLVTPGVATWDKAYVEGILDFQDLVLAARQWVPVVRDAGAEIVVLSAHTGQDADGLPWTPEEKIENLASSLATEVTGIDMIIAGHSHVDIPSELFRNPNGDPVLMTQPWFWARSAAKATLPIGTDSEGKHFVDWPDTDEEIVELATAMYSSEVDSSPVITDNEVLEGAHKAAIEYVNQVIATNVVEMTTDTSRYEDTPILDLIGYVMTQNVEKGLVGSEYEGIPVIAQTSPFSRTSVFPEGDLTVADVAGLYIYDNTLGASLLDGEMLKAYLEYSARYFVQATEVNPWNPETHTGAMYEGMTRPIPDYNYDALTGVNYKIDVTKPVGDRIVDLQHLDGTPVEDSDQFIMAVNNYRQNGGGGFPVSGFKTVWDDQLEIRQLIIDYAEEVKVIDPVNFFDENWTLITTAGGEEENAPSLTVEPATVEAGEDVFAWGENWTADEELSLTLVDKNVPRPTSATTSTTDVTFTATANAEGKFEAVLTIPTTVETGEYTLVATQGDLTAETDLKVTEAGGKEVVEVARYGGANRYDTNYLLNKDLIQPGKPVFIATGAVYADSLAVGSAVTQQDGALVLTSAKKLSADAVALIRENEPSQIYIIGGTSAVKDSVADQLKGVAPIERIGGADRYETSLMVANKFFPKSEKVYVATGRAFPDALSASAAAGATGSAVLLARGSSLDGLNQGALDYLASADAEQVLIVGGPSAVGKPTAATLIAAGLEVDRLGGDNRYETNLAVNEFLNDLYGSDTISGLWLATGKDFPDALSAAVPAGNADQRLVLSKGKCVPASALSWVDAPDSQVRNVTLVGGATVLSDAVENLTACAL